MLKPYCDVTKGNTDYVSNTTSKTPIKSPIIIPTIIPDISQLLPTINETPKNCANDTLDLCSLRSYLRG
jgi:hypothetical protein